jgi:hypothetical protein
MASAWSVEQLFSLSRMLKNSASRAHHGGCARAILAGPVGSARLHSRTMNKIVAVRPACGALVQGPAGLATGQRVKRRLQMHLVSPTSPAHVAASSDIMKKSFSATC